MKLWSFELGIKGVTRHTTDEIVRKCEMLVYPSEFKTWFALVLDLLVERSLGRLRGEGSGIVGSITSSNDRFEATLSKSDGDVPPEGSLGPTALEADSAGPASSPGMCSGTSTLRS